MIINGVHGLNVLLVKNLHRIRQLDFNVIVHLPRSGTIPASILATYLKTPFCSVDEYCNGIVNTRKATFKPLTEGLNKILIVDDSIATGVQLKAAMDKINAAVPGTKISSLAVYGVPRGDRMQEATLVLHTHPDKDYVYPWFLWKTIKVKDYAFDMDGVLCRDCTKEEDDEGAGYEKFLATAELKFHTEFEMGAIVTGRLEKYRAQTEKWLKKHGFKHKQLIMGPWQNNADRKAYGAGKWKGEVFARHKFKLFVESSAKESELIATAAKKTVFCIDNQMIYNETK